MLILVDLDGVLANFELAFLKAWRAKFPDEIYIPLAERKTFYIHEQYGKSLQQKVSEITNSAGFFRNMESIEDSVETVGKLVDCGHELIICTAPLSSNPTCVQEKYDWVLERFGKDFARNMVITKDKTIIRGNILIDDRPEISGRFSPEWEHVLFDTPYNADVKHPRRMNGWKEAQKLFC